jgi:hypothetical protein
MAHARPPRRVTVAVTSSALSGGAAILEGMRSRAR